MAGSALLMAATGCAPAARVEEKSDQNAATVASAPKEKAVDVSRYFPKEKQTGVEFVEDQLLGIAALPGGNIAEYNRGGKRYQQFMLKAPSAALAAVCLADIKSAMTNPKFVASFGGYFGELDGKPAFVFTKNEYVTGFIGLSRDEADAEGRVAAARIP
ncbi:MAG: hypothetical protein U5J83_16715 [Bryobacterales bacterium]|nr:hypothetical protein [Bryobacterales bacterium]